jgi:hypothetical protein
MYKVENRKLTIHWKQGMNSKRVKLKSRLSLCVKIGLTKEGRKNGCVTRLVDGVSMEMVSI